MELGGKFWLTFIAGAIGLAIAGLLFFLLLGNAWARWGFLGGCLFLAAILILFGWIYDKRDRRRRESLEAETAP